MTRLVRTTLGLALLAAAAEPALAQPAQRETFPWISVVGFPRYIGPDTGRTPPMRRAEALGDLVAWLPDNDPAVALVGATPDASGGVALALSVDGAGRVAGCDASQIHGDRRLAEGLCDRVSKRAKFTPAIDDAGARIADEYVFNISFNRAWEPRSPIVAVAGLSPAPPMATPQWPPSSDSQLVTVSKLDMLKAGPASPQAYSAPWAGIVYMPADAKQPCRVMKSSGDAVFDEKACKAAARAEYDVSGATQPYQRRMQLHFVLDGGKPRALVPVRKWGSLPQPTEAGLAIITEAVRALPADQAERLRLNVDVDASGAVTRCSIEASSGSDAGDVAACAAVRRAATFVAAEDIFGRPRAARQYDWNPLKPAKP